MIVINVFGEPCSGKSSVAAELYSKMKKRNYSVELVTEFAKELSYNGSSLIKDQLIVLGEQYRRVKVLEHKVDFVITDSPVLLSVVYSKFNNVFNTTGFKQVCLDAHNKFDSINILLDKNFDSFQENGRIHNEEEVIEIKSDLIRMLCDYNIPYTVHKTTDAVDEIIALCEKEIK